MDAERLRQLFAAVKAGEVLPDEAVAQLRHLPFEDLGFVVAPKQPMPMLTANALGDVPTVVLVGGSLLSGIYWITQRRQAVAVAEGRSASARPNDKERS